MANDLATVDTGKIETEYRSLAERATALAVVDQDSFVQCREVQKAIDSFIKKLGFEFDPGIAKANDLLDHLKQQKQKFVGPAQAEKERVRVLGDDWSAEEKRKAQAEADRINAEKRAKAAAEAAAELKQRQEAAELERLLREKELEKARKDGELTKKQAEKAKKEADAEAERKKKLAAEQAFATVANVQEVKVAASVPTVAGIKNQTFYFGDVEHAEWILDDYDAALVAHDVKRQIFLRQFMTINGQAVGKFARDTKDNKKAAEQVPGVRFWSKG